MFCSTVWLLSQSVCFVACGNMHFPAREAVSLFVFKVDSSKHGFFFAGDSYVILYKYGDDKSIVYFWQGSKTSTDEKGASAIHAARIDNEELGGKAVQASLLKPTWWILNINFRCAWSKARSQDISSRCLEVPWWSSAVTKFFVCKIKIYILQLRRKSLWI